MLEVLLAGFVLYLCEYIFIAEINLNWKYYFKYYFIYKSK